MNAGRHAAQDGSFVKSAGGAMSRGIILIVVAVVIGVLLIRSAVDDGTVEALGTQPETTAVATTAAPEATTDDTAAPETSEAATDTTADTAPSTSAVPDTTTTTAGGETTDGAEDPFEARPNAQVQVQVVNTTSVSGAAGRRTSDLSALGYVTLKATNSTDEGSLAVTKIHHIGGYLLEANELAIELGLDPETSVFAMPEAPDAIVAEFQNPHVLVLLGSDLAG